MGLKDMTLEQLDAACCDYEAKIEDLKDKQNKAVAERNRRLAAQQLVAQYRGLGQDEIAAIMKVRGLPPPQVAKPGVVEVGTPAST